MSMSISSEYSTKEIQLFKYFDVDTNHFTPPTAYRLAVETAFVNDMHGPEVQSLRRCARALRDTKVYRLTKEWDQMIWF